MQIDQLVNLYSGDVVVEHRTTLKYVHREILGSSPLVAACYVLEQGTFTPKSTWLIPRKRLLRPDMTKKLLTGTLNQICTPLDVVTSFHFRCVERYDGPPHKTEDKSQQNRTGTVSN